LALADRRPGAAGWRWPTGATACSADDEICEKVTDLQMPEFPIVIVGGGAAGLSAAGALKHAGLEAVVLDKDRQIGGTWARRYDRLRLHTIRSLSGLAHASIARDLPRYLARDQFVAYLRDYARRFELTIVAGCAARAVQMESDGRRPTWLVKSDCGV